MLNPNVDLKNWPWQTFMIHTLKSLKFLQSSGQGSLDAVPPRNEM